MVELGRADTWTGPRSLNSAMWYMVGPVSDVGVTAYTHLKLCKWDTSGSAMTKASKRSVQLNQESRTNIFAVYGGATRIVES